MSKADEMFEELGYKKKFNNYYEHDFGTTIEFLDKYKEINIRGSIETQELQAINMKCKELGWIENIRKDKMIRAGQAVIKGTRLTPCDVLNFMIDFVREHEDEFRKEYADISIKQIITAIDYILKNSISKDKIKEILDKQYIMILEGDTDFIDNTTKAHRVKYIKADDLEELLK